MRPRTLITHRLYFGIEAQRLRDGSGRVLSRVIGLAPERVRVRLSHLKQDFGVDTLEGRALAEGLVAEGLLRPRAGSPDDYFPTERFVEVAAARVVDPLPRARARLIAARAGELAARINAEEKANPLAVHAVAVFGSFMSLDAELAAIDLAVVTRPREAQRRLPWQRPLTRTEGARRIRSAFRALSSFVDAELVADLRDVPRPFAVVFQRA